MKIAYKLSLQWHCLDRRDNTKKYSNTSFLSQYRLTCSICNFTLFHKIKEKRCELVKYLQGQPFLEIKISAICLKCLHNNQFEYNISDQQDTSYYTVVNTIKL